MDDIEAGIARVLITYDIACQWAKYLFKRLMTYSFTRSINVISLELVPGVPKWHILGHAPPCQANFNLAYIDGVGMTHGESVKTIWSHSGSVAICTRENGPGARHLILDDHWNGWN